MKTKVNLYAPEFHPKLRLLSLQLTLLAGVAVFLLLFVIWLFVLGQQQALSQDLALSEQQKNQHLSTVTALQSLLANVKKDPQLLIEVEQNLQNLARKNRVLQELQGQEDLKSGGFARLLAELSDNHQSGLWLNHISLDGRNVQLAGAAMESSLIPKWLNNLGATRYFKGQEFAETRLFRDSEQQLNFVIASTMVSEKDHNAAGANSNE